MALYKDTNLTLYEVKHCVSGTCKANTRQWIHKLKLTCACDHPNITSHIFRHPCHHSRRPRVVRDWNHPIYMGLWPGAHFWGQGGGGHSPKGIPSRIHQAGKQYGRRGVEGSPPNCFQLPFIINFNFNFNITVIKFTWAFFSSSACSLRSQAQP